MSAIENLFQQAQLAEAAYANFINPDTGIIYNTDAGIQVALVASGFSSDPNNPTQSAQATDFVASWRVVGQFLDENESGFSATLFENVGSPRHYTLAVRGTDTWIGEDAEADVDVTLGGAAFNQLLSMVNYVLRLQAGSNSTTRQVELLSASGATAPSLTTTFVQGVGPGVAADQLTITGHSLGGFLGQMYQRIFGSAGVYTFNALGVVRPEAPVFDQLTSLLGLPQGSFSSGDGDNLVVPGDPARLIGTVQGNPQQEIFSEGANQGPLDAHRIAAVTDSLAVYNLLGKLDSSLVTGSEATITSILRAASNVATNSLEVTVSAIGKLLNVANTEFTGNVFDGAGRDLLYLALKDLNAALPSLGGAGSYSVSTLAGLPADTISSIAQAPLEDNADQAYRYALAALNPFAVTGFDYTAHNQNGALDLYDRNERTGTLTEAWIRDRAAFLVAKNGMYTVDRPFALAAYGAEPWHYEDKALGHTVPVTVPVLGFELQIPDSPRLAVFGGAGAETLQGDDQADRLYGGGGEDTLRGNGGDDYLEGGVGADTYQFFRGDGRDTILDVDGQGSIVFEGMQLTGGRSVGRDTWRGEDARFSYLFLPDSNGIGTLNILIVADAGVGAAISVLDFRSGDLGIVLEGLEPLIGVAPETSVDLIGDLEPLDADALTQGVQLAFDAYGNFLRDASRPDPDAQDSFIGSNLSDYVDAGGGNDQVQARGGDDYVEAGAGQDYIDGGAGEDFLVGGTGSDRIRGEAGDDWLYAEGIVTLEQAMDQSAVPTGVFQNWLSGGQGEDTLLGGADDDVLVGGAGRDFIVGGPGDDSIMADASYFPDGPGWSYFESDSQRIFGSVSGLYVVADGDADIIHAGAGNDWVRAGLGKDVLYGEAGNDNLAGEQGADLLFGGAGEDIMAGDADYVDAALHGADYLDGGEGNDILYGNGGDDTLIGGDGRDTLHGDAGNDFLEGGEDDDQLFGGAGKDLLLGGGGNDQLVGGAAADRLFGGAGNDTLLGDIEDDWLDGGEGDDILQGASGNDRLHGGGGNDQLIAGAGNDVLYGDAGEDTLFAESGNNVLDGGEGEDTLVAGSGRDVLDGGSGDDLLQGGDGRDLYLFGSGGGTDRIAGERGSNDLAFGEGIASAAIGMRVLAHDNYFSETGADQVLEISYGAGDKVRLEGGLRNVNTPLQFQDGEALTIAQWIGRAGGIELIGDDDNNTIEAMIGNAVVTPGGGSDLIIGGAGNTTYRIDRHSGWNNVFDFGGDDTFAFGEGITPEDIWLEVWHWSDFSPAFTLWVGDFEAAVQVHRGEQGAIEHYAFADGTVLTHAGMVARQGGLNELPPRIYPAELSQSSDSQILEGSDNAERIWDGDIGNVLYIPGKGDDTLYVFAGDSIGYLFRQGDGYDVILGDDQSDEAIYFDAGITPQSVRFAYQSYQYAGLTYTDLLIRYGTRGDMILVDAGGNFKPIERFWFADGRFFTFEELSAYIASLSAGPDTFGWQGTDADDVFASDLGIGGRWISQIDDHVLGLGGNDTLSTGAGNDYLDGGAGDDLLDGGSGDDTYVFGRGYGRDRIVETAEAESNRVEFLQGLDPTMLRVLREGEDLVLRVRDSDDRLTVTGWFRPAPRIGAFEFHDGSVWEAATVVLLLEGTPPVEITLAPVNLVQDQPALFALDAAALGAVTGLAARLADGAALPAWLAFDAGTLSFQADPDNDAVGLWAIALTGVNAGAPVTAHLVLTVANVNDPPELAQPLPDLVATEDAAFAFTVPQDTFRDVDAGDQLTLSATRADGSALPAWLAFDAESRSFSGTPVNGDVGMLQIRVQATDGAGALASDEFQLTVQNANDAPVVLVSFVARTTVLEDTTATAAFFVSNIFQDPDLGDRLTYSLRMQSGEPLPSWISFNAAAATATYRPKNGDVGLFPLYLVATDLSGEEARHSIEITALNVNDPPTLAAALPALDVIEHQAFAFVIPVGTFKDIDPGDSLTFSVRSTGGAVLPPWMSFDPATRTLAGAAGDFDRSVTLSVIATDSAGVSVATPLQVRVADTPDAPRALAGIADLAIDQDAALAFTLPDNAFIDPDPGDVLGYAASLVGGLPLPDWLRFDPATRTFTGTPSNDEVGEHRIAVTATDLSGAAVSDAFLITVINTNDAPVASEPIADQTALEDSVFSFVVPQQAFVDPDRDDVLFYAASLDGGAPLPGWLGFDALTRSFTGRPGNADVGSIRLRVSATDPESEFAASTFALTVVDVNDAPEFVGALPALSAITGQPFEYRLPGDLFVDIDAGDELGFSVGGAGGAALPGWLAFDPATHVLSGTPGPADYGIAGLEVIAADRRGAATAAPLTLAVSGVLRGSNAPDTLSGAGAGDLLDGGRGNDTLAGLAGADILAGGEDRDQLSGGDGNDLLMGQRDRDQLVGGEANDLLIGGRGEDLLRPGGGNDIVAFNRGDGEDELFSGAGAVTISLGGALAYRDLKLRKDKKDLVLELAPGDRLVFADWYAAGQTRAPVTLQVIAAAMSGFQPGGANPLLDNRVETFDFSALAAQFDASRSDPREDKWKLMEALLDVHLAGSDDAAIGGDFAYQYGLNGTLSGIGFTQAQAVLDASGFGAGPQALRPLAELQQGAIRLP